MNIMFLLAVFIIISITTDCIATAITIRNNWQMVKEHPKEARYVWWGYFMDVCVLIFCISYLIRY